MTYIIVSALKVSKSYINLESYKKMVVKNEVIETTMNSGNEKERKEKPKKCK